MRGRCHPADTRCTSRLEFSIILSQSEVRAHMPFDGRLALHNHLLTMRRSLTRGYGARSHTSCAASWPRRACACDVRVILCNAFVYVSESNRKSVTCQGSRDNSYCLRWEEMQDDKWHVQLPLREDWCRACESYRETRNASVTAGMVLNAGAGMLQFCCCKLWN